MLAGAATQATATPRASSPSGDMALAIPRIDVPGNDGVTLPRPLTAVTAGLLRAAFKDAGASLEGLRDHPLLGHVLANRLLSAAKPGADELQAWLERYSDQPDAPAIYAALVARLPRGTAPPVAPALPSFVSALPGDDVEANGPLLPRNPVLDGAVRSAARAGQIERAIGLVRRTRGITPEYGALLRAEIAQALFGQGRDAEALRLAEAATWQSQGQIGLAPWVAGLAAWRLGRTELARTWFEAAYRAPIIPPGRRAGAAFWAARAALVTRGDHAQWLRRAAQDPRTFYGLLARRLLRQSIEVESAAESTLGEADIEAIAATPRGSRAFGLLQVGQPTRAAAELRLLFSETREQAGFARSIRLVARTAGLAELSGQLDGLMEPAVVRLPAARLRPTGGFRFDPALVYALTRLESNFDAGAVSPAGARGLMQLMPSTAEIVLSGGRGGPIRLHDPATNLDIGQRYLSQLMQMEVVGKDLIRLLATYNAGPGNVVRWLDTLHEDDPLLFIESLPSAETRAYIPRALAYTWLYAAQLNLSSPSLDELALGRWPSVQAVQANRRDVTPRLH